MKFQLRHHHVIPWFVTTALDQSAREKSWRWSLHIFLLSFPRFWTFSVERFWFWFWSFLNGATLKTSNSTLPMKKEILYNSVIQALTSRSGLKRINTTHISLSLIRHSLPVSETFWKGKGRPRFTTFFWETNFLSLELFIKLISRTQISCKTFHVIYTLMYH